MDPLLINEIQKIKWFIRKEYKSNDTIRKIGFKQKQDMEETKDLLKSLFLNSINQVIRDIRELFSKVDEEPLTFTFILNTKRLIRAQEEELKEAVYNDIISLVQSHGCHAREYEIESYVHQSLIVNIEGHNRSFESKTSGSDYGLVVDIPQIDIDEMSVKSSYNGILIQAKRNALEDKIYDRYRELSNPDFDFSHVRNFFSLGLYKFENHNEHPRLSDFFFVPLESIEGNNQKFVKDVNCILRGDGCQEFLDAESFYSKFINGEIGITDGAKIKKYFYDNKKELPSLELRIYFEDGGDRLISLIRNTNSVNPNTFIQAERSRG